MSVCVCLRVCVCGSETVSAEGSGFRGGSFTTDTDKSFGTPNLPVSPLSLKLDQHERICLPVSVCVCVCVCARARLKSDFSCLLDKVPAVDQCLSL